MEGARLGPYQVLDELGSGGMGTVYRAEVVGDVPGLETGRAVALKVIHAHLLSQPGFFQRFLREADIGRSVQHENVVKTHVADALLHDGQQQNFLVMEYVEGQTLRDLLEELDRVPEELCRHIGREVAKGLAAIHEAGVLHRDLKPENVLITEEHVVKVMDLGVARLQDEAIRLSQAGSFVGSLEYAAPEQFRSADGEADARADLHALGVLLYELATGQHPYRDEDASKVLHNILEETPRRAGEVNPQLSPFFEEILQRLIAKERDERFPTASDLAAALDEGEKSNWWQERAKALRIETKRPLRRIRVPRETALYGRDDDLERLHVLYEKAKAGEGQVLLIEGEAGIGKTRLVDEFVARLRQEGEDIEFLFGSYPPGGAATASGAFSEAYREHFGAEGLEDALEDYLTVTPLLIPAFASLLKGDAPPQDAEPLTKDSLQTVFVHATRGLAAERTTIVLIDDLHFAPEDGRALFASLALAVPGHRILLVGTLRPGVPEEWVSSITRLDHAEQRSLLRLGPKDLVGLLKDAFRSERLAHELGIRIAEKSDGNPFFAFEIIRGLREGHFISQQPDGSWVTTRQIEDIQVPSSVLDLVNARVADLTEGERNLLDVAACCGFRFDPELVGDVLEMGPIPALQRLGRIEKRHRLVRSSGRSFIFDHHQVQEALYGGVSVPLRERYHAAIGEALEARHGARERAAAELDGAICVELCEHFFKAAMGERALPYLDQALGHLDQGYLNDQAIALADRALAVPDLLRGKRRLAVLLELNWRLDVLGRPQAQKAVLAEARRLAEEAGDQADLIQVERATGLLLSSTGPLQEALDHLERCLAVARETGDRASEAGAMINLGIVHMALGRDDLAQDHYQRGLAICREIGHREFEANATSNLGGLAFRRGQTEEARRQFEQALSIHREVGNRVNECVTTSNLGHTALARSRHEKARAWHEQALSISREIGYRLAEGTATACLGHLSKLLDRYAEAMAHLEKALLIVREAGAIGHEANVLSSLGLLWVHLGRRDEAREALNRALSISREMRIHEEIGLALWALSALANEEGDTAQAIELATESLALRRQGAREDALIQSLIRVGELKRQAGELSEAGIALDEAIELLEKRGEKPVYAVALRAILPDGDPGAAEAIIEEADEADNALPARYLLYKATGKLEHLGEAKRLLDYRVEHAPEAYRESMLDNVRMNREIMEAWEERGDMAEGGESAT